MSKPAVFYLVTCAIALVGSPALADEITSLDFSRDVRPILSDKCYKCHGPDEKMRQADLRLDRLREASHVLSPEEPAESELLRRITNTDPHEQMPPPDSKLELSQGEVDVLSRWIQSGSPHQQHWSYMPIQNVQLPEVRQSSWPKNEIDQFVLSALERLGLTPSPEGEKERLIRRLSFDLTGLPPTLEELDAFLEDDSDGAYVRVVDRLLENRSYGERMATDWLDLARYADSYGYQVDRDRFVWPWRDWVIKAFNTNMPFDRFVICQLAGDLLPDATDEQILATTFNRLHSQKTEGGSVLEEFRVEYVADRNHTFATAFLGMSLECARCHDHKYDPITQKEYYQLFAFFNNIDEAGVYPYHTESVPTPTLRLADAKTKERIRDVHQRIALAEEALDEVASQRAAAFDGWLEGQRALTAESEPASLDPDIPGRVAHIDFEEDPGDANQSVPGKVGQGIRLTGDDPVKLETGNFRRFEPFSIVLWMNTPDEKKRAVVYHRSKASSDAGSRGYQLLIEQGRLSASLVHFWPGNAIRVVARQPVPINQWTHVAVTYDGSSRATGVRIYVDGRHVECEVVRDRLRRNITGGGVDNIHIGARSRDRGFTQGLVDEFSAYERRLTPIEVAQLYDGNSLGKALRAPAGELATEQKTALREYYLATDDDEFAKRREALRAVREERSNITDEVREIMVMREMSPGRLTYVLKRGAYDAPTELVQPGTPAVFPPMGDDLPRNRLGLARWLTDPGHPLTARVAVNHYWQLLFGRGLVRTPEDFGSQGKAPTHPELLDWLARDFVEHEWNIKRLLKQMVCSTTYRQSSAVRPVQLARDPDNRWLSSFPRHRLPAEMIRDNALSVSGLLVNHVGGHWVKPYEVAVSFKPAEPDKGDGLYRRSVYTFWKRTAPAPVMMSLDASKREVCVVKRQRTSSPLQAIVLMNDPQLVEAARMLGQRMLQRHGNDAAALVEEIFRCVTSRRPSIRQREVLLQLYGEQMDHFEQNPGQAEEFLKTGEAAYDETISPPQLAAAGIVASVLMNYDECVMKR